MSKYIGPALPPHLQCDGASDSDEAESPRAGDADDGVLLLHDSDLSLDSEDSFGPSPPPKSKVSALRSPEKRKSDNREKELYGPVLPSHLKSKRTDSMKNDCDAKTSKARGKRRSDDSEDDTYGRVRSCQKRTDPVEFGPEANSSKSRAKRRSEDSNDGDDSYGPVLPLQLHIKSPRSEKPKSCVNDEESISGNGEGSNIYGPVLPPDLKSKSSNSSKLGSHVSVNESKSVNDEENKTYGPVLPLELQSKPSISVEDTYGPVLPREMKPECRDSGGESDDSFGPTLPPTLATPGGSGVKRAAIIGPALPPGLRLEESDEEEGEVIGPRPPPEGGESDPDYIRAQMEERAERMRRKLRGEDEEDPGVVRRETWMLELPPDRAQEFGLGPRQFRAKARLDPGDRSVWTDTPTDAQRRQANPEVDDAANVDEMQLQAIAERDRAMQKATDRHNKKKRKESLVDMHQKKLKKKKKKEEEKLKGQKKERRPFDRDVDLQANRFDKAQKKAVLRKAQLLDDRFSRGASKFL